MTDKFSCFARKLNKITKFIEENKEKFTQLDLEDVQVREKLKHATSKAKKLEKQLQKDKEKVGLREKILKISCLNIRSSFHYFSWIFLPIIT